MSSARLVPETWQLTGDDAAETLRRAETRRVVADAIQRLRVADGFSHARSLAFMILLTVIPGLIAVIGLAAVAGEGGLRDTITDALTGVGPGPAGDVLTSAIQQGSENGAAGKLAPLVFGLLAAILSGTTAFGQIERGANRIYGVEQDRPPLRKYGLALGLVVTSGLLVTLGFALFSGGRSLTETLALPGPGWLWAIVRLVLGAAAAAGAFTVIFKVSPRRRQPGFSWLAVGAAVATVLWIAVTGLLATLWATGDTFGDTYGPLAGLMGLALWSYLTSIGLFLGLAFAAQLEAVRAGLPRPQDEGKVAASDPSPLDEQVGAGAR
jgi:YihY family inner membrane protein